MTDYIESNRSLWNEWANMHVRSELYDVEGFKAGRSSLTALELAEVGDVSGKSLLHLQCHFGQDTLSWAQLGARVTGADFSDRAIELARSLSSELDTPATFVCSNIYDLPEVLDGRFGVVFTSYGAIYWLPDLARWAQVIAHFLEPGGVFYIADFHPVASIFQDDKRATELELAYPYFPQSEPLMFEVHGSYASAEDFDSIEYGWPHSMGEIVTSLAEAGLRIEFLHEFEYTFWPGKFAFMEQREEGRWYLKGQKVDIPLIFSIRATM